MRQWICLIQQPGKIGHGLTNNESYMASFQGAPGWRLEDRLRRLLIDFALIALFPERSPVQNNRFGGVGGGVDSYFIGDPFKKNQYSADLEVTG